jgi:hypothetical protein
MALTLVTAPWPVPHGWTFIQEDMPAIERVVGDYILSVGEDDGQWRWWLTPKTQIVSVARGDALDMVDGVTRALDALAKALEAA